MVEGDIGDIRLLGASPVGSVSSSLGGYNITDIYSTSSRKHSGVFDNGLWKRAAEQNYRITAPSASSTPEGFQWHGQLVKHGFPLPGNYSGFAGTLAMQKIPASNAFTTGLLWLIIMLVILSPLVLAIKLIVELLVHWKAINESRVDNLAYFRMNWLQFTTAMLLRSLLIGFGMIMFLTLFQFRFRSPPSSSALAAITFLIFFAGLASITSYIIYHRNTQFTVIPDQRPLVFERRSLLGVIPWFVLTRKNISASQKLQTTIPAVYPWWESCSDNQNSDESRFLLRYGWLTARFKDDSRYFFGIWLVYEFARACILGLGIASPIIQVAGLLILEVPFTIFLAVIAPFESKRLSAVIYALSFSNISSVLLSIPLQHQHDLSRIAAFAIGMVIIVIQSLLVFVLMLSMLTGIITSYISLSRRREIPSEQQSSHPIRMRYLEYIDRGANGRPMPPPSTPSPRSISPSTRDTGFTVRSVRRYPKIIDESPTPRNQIPSTPTSPQRMFHRLSAPSFHTMNPFTPSNAAGSAVSGFRNSDSFDPFYATTATDSVPSGFVNIDSLERRGDSVESLQYKLCRMTSIETAHSQSATGRDMSREHSLCLTDTFETAKSDFDPLTEFVTPPETRQTQGASQSKY
ncbi:hypothetical protein FQN49_005273 [Arthroderma sp. PD_2]|nr:hypothetical protein FQN49_005273 [Arthroderma sp. PD_2]